MGDDEFMESPEVAALVRRPVATLHVWRSRRQGPPAYKVRGRLLYRRSEVLLWLEEQRDADRLAPTRGGAA